VFHRGALGDSVLLWPRLRVWMHEGPAVLASERSKMELAKRELGIGVADLEDRRFNALWVEGAAVEPIRRVRRVVYYLGGTEAYRRNLRVMFPGVQVAHEPLPAGGEELAAFVRAHPHAAPPSRPNPHGPVALHVGAGSEAKRWRMERWAELARALAGFDIRLIAGEVERERLPASERELFESLGGRWIDSLSALADELRIARLVVACDSGPGHLAAQLGVRVVSFFGPTDPGRWGALGATIVAPDSPRPMGWLDADRAAAITRDAIR
jgi:hypothetical protein